MSGIERPTHPPYRSVSGITEHQANNLIHTRILEFERGFGESVRNQQSRFNQELQTTVTNAMQPVITTAASNAKSLGQLETEMKIIKVRIIVLTTVGLPIGGFLGFLAGHFI